MEEKLDDIIKRLQDIEESNSATSRTVQNLQSRMGGAKSGCRPKEQMIFNTAKIGMLARASHYGRSAPYSQKDEHDEEVLFKAKTKEGEEITVFVNKNAIPNTRGGDTSGSHRGGSQPSWFAHSTEDVQVEFRVLQDMYARVKLQTDMKFSGSRSGLKGPQKETVAVIGNCTKYAETAMRIQDQSSNPTYQVNIQLEELFVCMYAMIRYLQEDHCSLIVAGNYGKKGHK